MSIATSACRNSVLNVRNFMFGDIEKTLKLADDPTVGSPNLLLALGLCCYTEYWGKLLLGITRGHGTKGREAFNAFLKRLDSNYYPNLIKNADPYGKIRSGLANSYLINGDLDINTGRKGYHGIDFDPATKKYVFWIGTYFDEFKTAVTNYIKGLEAGTEDLKKFEDCMKDGPELV
jgi:hypothetical protein